MKSGNLIFASLCLATAAFAGSASAQARPVLATVPGDHSIVIYDQPSYQGTNANFTSSTANVGPEWRRNARSITINSGTWLVCEDPNFNGRCATLTQSIPDLASSNLRRVGSFRPVRSANTAGMGGRRGWYVVVYNRTNYRGTARRYSKAISNLGNTPVRSLTIGRGSWEICSDRNFGGDCVTINQSVPDLSTEGFSGYVHSIRPATAPR